MELTSNITIEKENTKNLIQRVTEFVQVGHC